MMGAPDPYLQPGTSQDDIDRYYDDDWSLDPNDEDEDNDAGHEGGGGYGDEEEEDDDIDF